MGIDSLIALGGTNVQSPLRRYFQAKQDAEQEQARLMQNQLARLQLEAAPEQNRLALLAAQQGVDLNALNLDKAKKLNPLEIVAKQSEIIQKQREAHYKQVAPYIQEVLALPQEKRGQTWRQLVSQTPELKGAPNQWDDTRMQSIVSKYGQDVYAPVYDKDGLPVAQRNLKTNQLSKNPMAPDVQVTMTPEQYRFGKKGAEKVLDESRKSYNSTIQAAHAIDEIADMVKSPQWTGGSLLSGITAINSMTGQLKTIFGIEENVVDKDGNVDMSKINPKLAEDKGFIERLGGMGVAYRSAVIDLAWTIAKARNGSRISDADFRLAEKMVGDSGSKSAMLNNLNLFQKRIIRNHNDSENTNVEYSEGRYKPHYIEYKSSVFNQQKPEQNTMPHMVDISGMSDEEMQAYYKRLQTMRGEQLVKQK